MVYWILVFGGHGVQFIDQGVTFARAKELHQNGLQIMDDIWGMELREFIPWEEAQNRFGLEEHEEDVWNLIIRCIMEKWHINILEKNWEVVQHSLWIGIIGFLLIVFLIQ